MKIEIRPFSIEDKISVLSVSDQEVGKNFIDQDYLNFFLNNLNAGGIVAIIHEEVVGFSFFQWCSVNELSKYIFTDKNWLTETVNIKKKDSPSSVYGEHSRTILIGYRNLTAVKQDFQNKGVGSRLVDFSIKKLKKKSNIIVNVVWKAENKINLGNTLLRYGLKPVKTITDYWREDSIKRNYDCAVCGRPPCKCTAEIYIYNDCPN